MAHAASDIWKKVAAFYVIALIVTAIALFVPAGTTDYYQAWAYMAILFIPVLFVFVYALKTDPEFLERRMMFREKVGAQKKIIFAADMLFIVGFLVPGLDRRFGWSQVPFELVIAADAAVFLGYLMVIVVLNENRYASRIIQVEKGQKVVSSGPYSIIRHPKYLGTLVMYLATPIALGSYWALIPFLSLPVIVVYRILNEEEVLLRELPGYAEYCKKTRYRLIPFVW
ncbi:isoprenylcysteine carboxylmethyltransferase family protein [Candidatus Micrarchaeota archaeon]|nr:isoprenylcysteine carboxylmethyltransferase family protein [Candidatus Micrarchaeota archaeon]